MPIPMMSYSFDGGGASLSSSNFQGKGSPSRKDYLVSNILKLAAALICLNLASLMRHGVDVNHHPVGNPKRKV
jgi:hypothetical protein